MRPNVSPALRNAVAEMVGGVNDSLVRSWDRSVWSRLRQPREPLTVAFASLLPDVQHFHSQTGQLEFESIPQYAVSFRDDGPDGDPLPVLVQVPDLQNVKASYEFL